MANDADSNPPSPARRDFLRWVGIGSAAVVAAGSMPFLLAEVEGRTAEEPTGRKRKWTMLVDLRRCDGCKRCELACQETHNSPDGQSWIKVFSLTTASGTFHMPRPCMHCENAPCWKVCPVGATFRSEDGLILIDEDRCIGCRYCMAACPYDARSFNWTKGAAPKTYLDPLGPSHSSGHVDHRQGVVEKCTFCAHRLAIGRLPVCVESCSMRAIYFGDANEDFLSNGVERIRLSKVLSTQQAFRYKEELGTEPRVYYLPVRR